MNNISALCIFQGTVISIGLLELKNWKTYHLHTSFSGGSPTASVMRVLFFRLSVNVIDYVGSVK